MNPFRIPINKPLHVSLSGDKPASETVISYIEVLYDDSVAEQMYQKLKTFCMNSNPKDIVGILLGPMEYLKLKVMVAHQVGKAYVDSVERFRGYPVYVMTGPGVELMIDPEKAVLHTEEYKAFTKKEK